MSKLYKEIPAFGNTEIQKRKFYLSKQTAHIMHLHIDEAVIPKRVRFSKKSYKYSVGYKDDDKVSSPIYIML